ncbi:quinone oxidoreductase family protein [Lacibacterium aquatile]|uniref:Quinone oxidoreductase family protein n=1 Tax=Lacibacterium aquatile TaxID=1168082 RepID=A0ABW5DXT1_9PROT
MPQTVNAVRIHEHGGPEVLRWEQVEVGDPGPGEVLLRHTAIGLNFIEIYQRSGLYKVQLPIVLGQEGAGVIEAIGAGVTGYKVGERVGYAGYSAGAYSEKRLFPAERLVKIPDAISDEVAAAVLLGGMTTRYLLRETYVVKPGDTVLFHAAVGGVGLIATQWLKALGAIVIGTVSTKEKAELAKQNGCDHVLLYSDGDIAAKVREITGGKGVPVVYDSVGKDTWEASINSVAQRGMMVSFGNASGAVPAIEPLLLSQKGSLFLTRPTLGHYVSTPEALQANAAELFSVIASGKVKPHIGQRYALKDVAQAQIDLASRKTVGSTVLIP